MKDPNAVNLKSRNEMRELLLAVVLMALLVVSYF